MMDFLELIRSRKSIRSFSEKLVTAELIEKIIVAATYAPTACNQQLWNFVVVTDGFLKERLIKEAASSTIIRKAPVVVVVSYDGWNYKEAIQGGSLAVSHILLAAHNYGLGSVPINSYGDDSKVKNILDIPKNQTISCFILLGYPDEKARLAPVVPRRRVDEVIHWEHFSSPQSISYNYDPETWTIDSLITHQKNFCRKTFLGKEMDIMSDWERHLVKRELTNISSPILDLFSYDGAYLREFPVVADVTTFDLCEETAKYTREAYKATDRENKSWFIGQPKPIPAFRTNTIIFKLERLPKALRQQVYQITDEELIIIARKRNLFLSFFFWLVELFFGPDVRRTSIFAFFGPYQPLVLPKIIQELKEEGFKQIRWTGYFILPPFLEQIYQMFLQYRASGGSSYLHRNHRVDIISRLISFLLRIQGMRSAGWLGSVVVIRCRK